MLKAFLNVSNVTYLILLIELIVIIWGFRVVRKKNNIEFVFLALTVFALNWWLCYLPLGKGDGWVKFLSSFSAAVKHFVGEVEIDDEIVKNAKNFSGYYLALAVAVGMAVTTAFTTVIKIFSINALNDLRYWKKLKGECDIVLGCSEAALEYAKKSKNVVLLLEETVDEDQVKSLIEDGYIIKKKNLTAELLKQWNGKDFNIICPNESGKFSENMNEILSYIEDITKKAAEIKDSTENNDVESADEPEKKKGIHFYLELDETAKKVFQNQLDRKKTSGKDGSEKDLWCACHEYITVFSRNELMARMFVEENPITKYMPSNLLVEDTSVKSDAKINVFILGFGGLSKEIYKQFVINNQLVTFKDGEYRGLPINYHIYDEKADSRVWEIDGLKDSLEELAENADEYFTLPDMPYETKCCKEDMYEFDCVKRICNQIQKDSFSYIIIDTGDVARNIDVSKKFKLLIGEYDNFHIFIYDNSSVSLADEDVCCYGKLDEVFCPDVVVNETLIELAMEINKEYIKGGKTPENEKEKKRIEKENLESWKNATYFTMYSNIYLANSIRMKLNLMGLDYRKDGEGKGIELIRTDIEYKDYHERSITNAFLAQEHARWNAYHLMNGFLPMKKEKVNKNNKKDEYEKKHSCLTTFRGLGEEWAVHLENGDKKQGEILVKKNYTYDGMLIKIAPAFFRKKGYSVFKKEICVDKDGTKE